MARLTREFCDGISGFFLKEGNHDVCVDFYSDDGHQDGQRDVGEDADEGVVADGYQSDENGAEDDPGVHGVLPLVGALETHDELQQKGECFIDAFFSLGLTAVPLLLLLLPPKIVQDRTVMLSLLHW